MVIFFKLIAVITLASIASSQSIDSAHLSSDGLPDDTLTAGSSLTSVEDSAHIPHPSNDGSIGSSNHKPPPALLFFSSHASRAQDSAHSPRVQYSDCPDDSLAVPAHSYVIREVFLSSARNSAHFSPARRDSIDSDVIPQVGRPTTPLNDDSAHHRRSARSVSSSDNFETSVDRLRAVARIATGIYLTQELIKGTDKQVEIASELLKLGSINSVKINELNYGAVLTAMSELKSLARKLNIQTEMRRIIVNAEAGITIKNNFANMTSITYWPEMSEIKSALDGIHLNSVKSVQENFFDQLNNFYNEYISGADDTGKPSRLTALINNLLSNLPLVKANVKFSSTGWASDDFSRIRRIIRSLESLNKIAQAQSDAKVINTLNTFFEAANKTAQIADDLKTVNEVIKTIHLSGSLRDLIHTTGFFEGQEDLSRIHTDLTDQWMKNLINSNSFGKSMEVFNKLDSSLRKAYNKFRNIDEHGIAAFKKFASDVEKFVRISSKKKEIENALRIVSNSTIAVQRFDDAVTVMTNVKELDGLYVTYWSNIQTALQKIENNNIIAKLEKFKAILEKPDNRGKTMNQIFTNGRLEQNRLSTQVYDFMYNFEAPNIKNKASYISGVLGMVSSSLEPIASSADNLKKVVNVENMDLVEDFFHLFNTVENANTLSRLNDPNVLITMREVMLASAHLTTVLNAISEVKGAITEESKSLDLLGNPMEVSNRIGNAVRGIGEIQKAVEAIPVMNDVVDNQMNVAVERLGVLDDLTATEIFQIRALENLDFTSLIAELNTFKSAVDPKRLENLQDSGAIFDEAMKLNGIQEDLPGMLEAFHKLMILSTNPLNLVPMKIALTELRNIQLDFKKFHQYYEPAKTSMKELEIFFANYASSVSERSDSVLIKPMKIGRWKKARDFPQPPAEPVEEREPPSWWSQVLLFIGIIFASCVCSTILSMLYAYHCFG